MKFVIKLKRVSKREISFFFAAVVWIVTQRFFAWRPRDESLRQRSVTEPYVIKQRAHWTSPFTVVIRQLCVQSTISSVYKDKPKSNWFPKVCCKFLCYSMMSSTCLPRSPAPGTAAAARSRSPSPTRNNNSSTNGNPSTSVKTKLQLVDLAGSECVGKEQTHAMNGHVFWVILYSFTSFLASLHGCCWSEKARKFFFIVGEKSAILVYR